MIGFLVGFHLIGIILVVVSNVCSHGKFIKEISAFSRLSRIPNSSTVPFFSSPLIICGYFIFPACYFTFHKWPLTSFPYNNAENLLFALWHLESRIYYLVLISSSMVPPIEVLLRTYKIMLWFWNKNIILLFIKLNSFFYQLFKSALKRMLRSVHFTTY